MNTKTKTTGRDSSFTEANNSQTRYDLDRRWKYVVGQIEEADFAVSGERFAEAAQAIGRAMREAALCKHDLELLSENKP